MVTFVASSRMYRGMHHPLDVAGGAARRHRRADRRRLRVPRRPAQRPRAPRDEGRRDRTLRQDASAVACPSCAACSRRKGIDDPLWCRGAEEPQGAAAGAARARRGLRARLRLGRRRDGAALHRRARRLEGEPRDHPRRDREPVRVEPRDPARTSRRRSRSDFAASAASSTSAASTASGSRVMAGAGFDAAMIRGADGGLKDRFGRVAYVWTGSENLRSEAVPRRRSRSTASAGTRARRAASCSATSASCSAASRRSRTRDPTTASSSSGSSRPTACSSGAACSRARPSARRASRRSPRRRRRSR